MTGAQLKISENLYSPKEKMVYTHKCWLTNTAQIKVGMQINVDFVQNIRVWESVIVSAFSLSRNIKGG